MENKFFWIYLLLGLVDIFVLCGSWSVILTPRYEGKVVFAVNVLIFLGISAIKIGGVIPWDAKMMLISNIAMFLSVILGFKDSFPIRLFGFLVIEMITACSEFMSRLITVALGRTIEWSTAAWKGPTLIVPMILVNIFSIFFAVIILWIWNSNVKKQSVAGIQYYLCLPISQVFFVMGFVEYNVNVVMQDTVITLLGFTINGCGAMVLCVLWKWQAQKEELLDRYRKVHMLMEQEKVYYSDWEERIEEFSRLRHEWNNYLTTFYYFNEYEDNQEEAIQVLRYLKEKIAVTNQ